MTQSLRIIHHPLPFGLLDQDAVTIVRRLRRFGHSAFLVGGCLRDLLLGVQPKDFDIATSAHPREIKKLFRNCRLIGRRFRLAHLLYRDRKIVEVATFRRAPTPEEEADPDLSGDNLFGSAQEDANRRDFTINALFYDVQHGEFHDFVGGVADIERRLVRTIGDADARIPEDPVRILRAVKFASRLNLVLDPSLREALERHAQSITRSAQPRVLEEIFRLLRPGCGAKAMALAHEIKVLREIVPEASGALENPAIRSALLEDLGRADTMIKEGRALSDAVLLSTLLWRPISRAMNGCDNVSRAIEEFLQPLALRLCVPKRIMSRLRQVVFAQRRLRHPERKRSRQIIGREFFGEALDLLEITSGSPETLSLACQWRDMARGGDAIRNATPPPLPRPRRRRRNHSRTGTKPAETVP